jgi:hypothetical protein
MPFDHSFANQLGLAGKREIPFHQKLGMDLLDKDVKTEVEGGYCFGASMTWLKLCLIKESAATAINHEQVKTVSKMALSQVNYFNAAKRAGEKLRDAAIKMSSQQYDKIEDFRQEELAAAKTERQSMLDKVSENWSEWYGNVTRRQLTRSEAEAEARNGPKPLDPELQKAIAAKRAEYDKTENMIHELYDRRVASAGSTAQKKYNTMQSSSVTEEDTVKKTWKILKKVGEGAYTGDITPVCRIGDDGARTIGEFVCKVVSSPAFKVGRGMIINFNTGKSTETKSTVLSPPGHALALHRIDNERYRLFEPNLGVYLIANRVKLIYSFILVLADGYDKRVLANDNAIIFCKTTDVFPDQGGNATDPSALVERDKAKAMMERQLPILVKDAFDKAVEAVRLKTKWDQEQEQAKNLNLVREKIDLMPRGSDERNVAIDKYTVALEKFQNKEKTESEALKSAAKEMRDAFLNVRLINPNTTSMELLKQVSNTAFFRNKGKIEDTGLYELFGSLDQIF